MEAWQAHVAALRAVNEDRGDGKPVADACATPLLALADAPAHAEPALAHAADVGFRFDSCAFVTRRHSQEVWNALTQIEALFSDIRRLAPAFAFAQLRGEARIAARNEYRFATTARDYLARLNGAMGDAAALTIRRMDLRILRAGPFGGETADVTWATLANHRLAGLSSFWVVVHGDGESGIRVSLEAAELFRWNWGPELLADLLHPAADLAEETRVLNWPWCFERLAAALDGEPLAGTARSVALSGPWRTVGADPALRQALPTHPSLGTLAARLDAHGR